MAKLHVLICLLLAVPALSSPKPGRLDPIAESAINVAGSTPTVPANAFEAGYVHPTEGAKAILKGAVANTLEQMVNLKVASRDAAAAVYKPAEAWLATNNRKELLKLYKRWKSEHGVTYTGIEDRQRFRAFKKNLAQIVQRNQDKAQELWYGLGPYSATTWQEFEDTYLKLSPAPEGAFNTSLKGVGLKALAPAGDWSAGAAWYGSSANGYVTPVKNQGKCGNCWAMSTTAAFESKWLIQTGTIYPNLRLDASEQILTSCCVSANGCKYSTGCGGGVETEALSFMMRLFTVSEARYPFTSWVNGVTGSCQAAMLNSLPTTARAQISGYSSGYVNSASVLMQIVWVQPVVVAINVGSGFQNYKGGYVAGSEVCGSGTGVNHAVLVVGFNAAYNPPYWIIKNSWTTSWGTQGYGFLRMDSSSPGVCNMYTRISFPGSLSRTYSS